MPYQNLNEFLKLLGLNAENETPVNTDSAAQAGAGNGLLMGEAAINNINKRFWIGMGRYQAPIEISSVVTLTVSGQTPDINKFYNAGTLIVNTIDNLIWIGTGNTGTGNSFIALNTNSNSVYVTGINLSTAGEILVSYSNGNVVNLGDVIELNDPNYPVDGGNFDLDGGEF